MMVQMISYDLKLNKKEYKTVRLKPYIIKDDTPLNRKKKKLKEVKNVTLEFDAR